MAIMDKVTSPPLLLESEPGMQHLGQVLQAHSQVPLTVARGACGHANHGSHGSLLKPVKEVPDIIAQRYGPPQQPRLEPEL